MYLCTSIISDVVETQNVSVIVLYPPSYPDIEGTTSGLIGEEVTLKCISNANPPPTYQWKRFNQNGVVLSRNQTLQISISEENSRVVCVAQSLMVTTLGKSKRADVAREVTIFSYVGAIIHAIDKGSNLKLIEGEDIDILCDAIGRPVPDVWWTKTGNKSFSFFGKRLIGYDIDKHFPGTYVCHAGNNITSVNKTVIETYTTKLIYVKVTESLVSRLACSSVECAGYYERDLSTDNTTNGKTDFTLDDTINPEEKDKELVLIITDVIGWTALAISIIINIWFCKVNKRNTEKLSTIKTQTEQPSEMSAYSYARSLPERPSSYITEVRLPEHTYFELNSGDMINSGQNDSFDINLTGSYPSVSSDSSYLEPIYTSSHPSN
ncbi:uncharacterized protein LOC123554656 [Mercenaria mercenaria]|uniref:uncharacterized protein LOC123554656 n=1 Tax=Mercenaria mercenaria TaxID=6596 RepID=UPI00234EF380|nr:uncharacterized protein LOC123554656 [Mercenaria mercenaria]